MTDSNIPSHEQIAQRAYEIFLERGKPAGQDLAHWLEAERQLSSGGQQPQAAAKASTTATSLQTAAIAGAAPNRAPQTSGRANGNGKTPARATARK